MVKLFSVLGLSNRKALALPDPIRDLGPARSQLTVDAPGFDSPDGCPGA